MPEWAAFTPIEAAERLKKLSVYVRMDPLTTALLPSWSPRVRAAITPILLGMNGSFQS